MFDSFFSLGDDAIFIYVKHKSYSLVAIKYLSYNTSRQTGHQGRIKKIYIIQKSSQKKTKKKQMNEADLNGS